MREQNLGLQAGLGDRRGWVEPLLPGGELPGSLRGFCGRQVNDNPFGAVAALAVRPAEGVNTPEALAEWTLFLERLTSYGVLAARWGLDRFLLLLPAAGPGRAEAVAQVLLREWQAAPVSGTAPAVRWVSGRWRELPALLAQLDRGPHPVQQAS